MERKVIGTVRAVYDYEAAAPNELTLVGGRTYALLAKNGDGWWEGIDNRKTGFFPSNFVEELPPDTKEKAPIRPLAESSESSIGLEIVPVRSSVVIPPPPPPPLRVPRSSSLELLRVGRDTKKNEKRPLVGSQEPKRATFAPPYKSAPYDSAPTWPEFLPDIASDEILMNIFVYLDDKSLLQCASVCKRFQTVTEDRRLWVRHNRKKFKKSRDVRGNVEGKQFFLREMRNNWEQARRRREQERLQRQQEEERRKNEQIAEVAFLPAQILCHCNAYDIVLVLLFLLFGVFVALRADRLVTWKYVLICIPLFIMAGILLIRSLSLILPWFQIALEEDVDSSESYSSLSSLGQQWMMNESWAKYNEPEPHWSIRYPLRAFGVVMFVAAATFLLLIALKLSHIDMSARVVLIPMWVGYASLLLHCAMSWWADRHFALQCVISLFILPWAIYALLIALKVDGKLDCSWVVVQIPAWIGMFLSAFAPIIITVWDDGWDGCWSGLWVFFGLLCCPIGPVVAFQVLVALKLDGGLTHAAWRTAFVPFYFIMILACCGVGILNALRMCGTALFGDDD